MADIRKPSARVVPTYLAGIQHSGDEPVTSDLSLNENLLGPSERAVLAFSQASSVLWRYPDGSHGRLKEAIAARFKIDPRQIVCGAGADELITLLTRLFVAAGEEVLFPAFSFAMFSVNALRVGSTPIAAQTDGLVPSVKGLLEGITERTRAVFIASPNNPTGAYLTRGDLRRLAGRIPAHIPFIIDGAYAEYVDSRDYSDGLDLLDEFPNLVVIRTFSKAYGLASLRIGWCCTTSGAIVDGLERLRGPYNISGPAQAAAIAALGDEDHTRRTRLHNRCWRDRVRLAIKEMGLHCASSGGNFVMMQCSSPESARSFYQHLRRRGILVRRLRDYNLPQCLRITIGASGDNEQLIEALWEARHGTPKL
jgi:histidinol-phosphate aminotransferase